MTRGRSVAGKTVVMGLLDRHGKDGVSQVRIQILKNIRKYDLQGVIYEHVKIGANVYTDALRSYDGLSDDYAHGVIDHAEAYVDGAVHTNGLENFWSLLKRAIKGTYVSVEPFHLFRYLDEQMFRFNNRKGTDAMRFALALKGILNKRLTNSALTGSELRQTC
jgi:transposase-like protein